MKDFDAERAQKHAERALDLEERTFLLGGERFTYRTEVSYLVLERISAIGDDGGSGLIRDLERAVLDLLEPGQEDLFLDVVHRDDDPVTLADLNDLAQWLTEAQVNRPTKAPSLSTDGREATGTDSTENSSSPPAVVSAA